MLKTTVPEQYYFVLALLIFFLILALVRTFQSLKAYRAVKHTPTSKIRSAAQGFVELIGKQSALHEAPQVSPLSFSPCTWYRYRIERWVQRGKNSYWETQHEENSNAPFLIQDDTGQCWVFPKGADCLTRTSIVKYSPDGRPWYENHSPRAKESSGQWLWRVLTMIVSSLLFQQCYRHREELMSPGDPFYGLGLFQSHYPGKNAALLLLLDEAKHPHPDEATHLPLNTLSQGNPDNPCPFVIANSPQKKVITQERITLTLLTLVDLTLLAGLAYYITSFAA